MFSLSKHDGFVRASDYFDRRIASDNLSKYKVVRPGNFAYSTIHIDEGSIAQNSLDSPVAISPMYTTLQLIDTDASAEYLALLLRTPLMLATYARLASGTVNRRRSLPFKAFAAIEIWLPTIEEQKQVVRLARCFEVALSKANEVITSAQTAREAIEAEMIALLTKVPAVALAQIADVVSGVTKDAKKQVDPTFVHVPYLRVANVQRGFFDLDAITEIRVPQKAVDNLRLLPGDVLFNEGGDRDKLGRGSVWDGEISTCIHQNHVLRARIETATFDPWFISLWGNSFGRTWFEQMGMQTTNLASLSLGNLKKFPVPDIPLDQQQMWIEQSSKLRAVEATARKYAIATAKARDAIIRSLIAGIHRLPQPETLAS